MWRLENLCVFRENVRTNNDVEGWNRALNTKASGSKLLSYILVNNGCLSDDAFGDSLNEHLCLVWDDSELPPRTMESQTHDLKNRLFCNWVKGGTALKYFTAGLKEFVDGDLRALHQSILKDIERSLNCGTDICCECSIHNILPCVPPRTCVYGKNKCSVHTDSQNKPAECKLGSCKIFYDKIKGYHQSGKPSWRNTEAQRWKSDHIEIGKCFLSQCEASRKVKSIRDVDTIGLLDIIETNKHIGNSLSFHVKSSNNILYKCKLVRKAVFHTENFELSDEKIDSYIKDLIELLEDSKGLCYDQNAQTAVLQLKQLANMTVTLQDEEEVRKEALKQIRIEKAQASASVQDEQANSVSRLQRELHRSIKDVNEQHQSLSLSMFALKDDFEAMGLSHSLEFKSIAETQEKIKQNLTDFSKSVKGEVKELVVQTLEELKEDKESPRPEDGMQRFQDHLQNLDERVHQLEQGFSSMKKDLVKFERLEQLHKHDMESRSLMTDYQKRKLDLQEELCMKYNKKRRCSNVPLNSDVDVNKIYTEQMILSTDFLGSPTDDSISNNGGYRDVLSKDGQMCQRVVLLGKVGHGKTVYCYKLLQEWTESLRKVKMKEYSSLSEDEVFLSKFTFVFYIELENVMDETNVIDMICAQIFGISTDRFKEGHQRKYQTMLEVFEKEPSECLIILDGLDKWNPTVSRKGLYNQYLPIQPFSGSCVTLIACRVSKWHTILYSLSEGDIDKVHLVDGLAKQTDALQSLVKVYDDKKQTGTEEITVFHEFDKLSSDPIINDVMTVPAIFHFSVWSMLCYGGLRESKTSLMSRIVVFLFEYMHNWKCDRNTDKERCSPKSNKEHDLFPILPEPLRTSDVMSRYITELSKMALLAFNDLVHVGDQSPLIIKETELRKFEIALKTGIITQERATGYIRHRKVKLSFLCTSLQHFVAAIHLVMSRCDSQPVRELLEFCSEESRLYEIENVLLFAFCMVPALCEHVTKSLCEKDNHTVDQEPSDRKRYLFLRFLQELEEHYKIPPNPCKFYMESLRLSSRDFAPGQRELNLKLYQSNVQNLKHLIAISDDAMLSHSTASDVGMMSNDILDSMWLASSLVKLELTNMVITGKGASFTHLSALKILKLDNVTSRDKEQIDLRYSSLHTLECKNIKWMKIMISSTMLRTIIMERCTDVQLKAEQLTGYLNLSTSDLVDLKCLDSIKCLHLQRCIIDFKNASMNLKTLVVKGCHDCQILLDQDQVEGDMCSSNTSSLYSYLPDISKLWSDSTSSQNISIVQNVRIWGNCREIIIRAFAIVSNCSVEECTDSEISFHSNVKDSEGFAEVTDTNRNPMCLQAVNIKDVKGDCKRSSISFRNMPLQIMSVGINNVCNCEILMDCFDVGLTTIIAENFFTHSRSIDFRPVYERTLHLKLIKKVELVLKTACIYLNDVHLESCKESTLTFKQGSTGMSLDESSSRAVSELSPPHISFLKCTSVSKCIILGLKEAEIRQCSVESCDLEWTDFPWHNVQRLHVENLPESAACISQTLNDSGRLQSISCHLLHPRMLMALGVKVPTLSSLTTAIIGKNGPSTAALLNLLKASGRFENLTYGRVETLSNSGILETPLRSLTDQEVDDVFCIIPEIKGLKTLELVGLSESELVALQNIKTKLPLLEHLTISHCTEGKHDFRVVNCVSKTPKLKRLTCRSIPAGFLFGLQSCKLKHLVAFEAAGPFIGKLKPEHLSFLNNVPKSKTPFTVICSGLKSENFKAIMEAASLMKRSLHVEIHNMVRLDASVFASTLDLKMLSFRDVEIELVIEVLNSISNTHLERVHLENIAKAERETPASFQTRWTIDNLKLSRISTLALKDLTALYGNMCSTNTVELSFVALDKSLIEPILRLKKIKKLKLQHVVVNDCDLEPLERCVGELEVEELTLCDITFRGSSLDLSNAYKLRVINLTNVYMGSKAWINSFKKLPKLLDAREMGIVSEEFILVESVERRHSTSVRKILLQNVCITEEAIRAMKDFGLFQKADWTCLRQGSPSIYNVEFRSKKKT